MRLTKFTLGALSGVVAVAMATAAHAQAEHQWRIQTMWQAGTINQEVFERFAERVETMSDGRIVIETLPVGAVVGLFETLDAVSAGILDGHQSAPVYFAGRDPGFAVIGDLAGAFSGSEGPYQMQEIMEYYGGLDLLREMYGQHNMHTVGVLWWGVESLPSKVALNTLSDLQGIQIRVPGGIGADVFAAAGSAPVNLPGAEVYTALERGVVDAADWGTLSMNYDLGYHEIAEYFIYPGFHAMPMGDVSINQSRWEALSPDLQEIVTVAVRDFARDMIQSVAIEDASALSKKIEEGGQSISWSDEDIRGFRQIARDVWEDYAGRSEFARRALDIQVDYLRERGLIDD